MESDSISSAKDAGVEGVGAVAGQVGSRRERGGAAC